jgi:hypothetical protein
MSKVINLAGNVENGQFSGGQNVTGSSPIGSLPFVANGLYVGNVGNLTVKTVDGSIMTFVSASGFIPGLITGVSSSFSGSIVALR